MYFLLKTGFLVWTSDSERSILIKVQMKSHSVISFVAVFRETSSHPSRGEEVSEILIESFICGVISDLAPDI